MLAGFTPPHPSLAGARHRAATSAAPMPSRATPTQLKPQAEAGPSHDGHSGQHLSSRAVLDGAHKQHDHGRVLSAGRPQLCDRRTAHLLPHALRLPACFYLRLYCCGCIRCAYCILEGWDGQADGGLGPGMGYCVHNRDSALLSCCKRGIKH